MGASVMTQTTQYLTCKLGEETFAIEIAKVREVLDFSAAMPVPRMPDFMLGVINLRGAVVPVVDMRLKFGMPKTEKSENTCVIIVDVTVDGQSTVVGALADSVQEVIDLAAEEVEAAPQIGTRIRTGFITGMGKQNGRFVMLLDIDKVFGEEGLPANRAALN